MFANMQNYKFYKCIFAYLQVNAHDQFACFQTCVYYKIVKL